MSQYVDENFRKPTAQDRQPLQPLRHEPIPPGTVKHHNRPGANCPANPAMPGWQRLPHRPDPEKLLGLLRFQGLHGLCETRG